MLESTESRLGKPQTSGSYPSPEVEATTNRRCIQPAERIGFDRRGPEPTHSSATPYLHGPYVQFLTPRLASFGDFSSIFSSQSSMAASDRRSWGDWLPSAGSSSEAIGRMIFHRSDLPRKFLSRDWLRSAVFSDADERRRDHDYERPAITNCQGAGAMAHRPIFNDTSRMRIAENGPTAVEERGRSYAAADQR
ncbi:hypothetical protein [Planctomyces sp. SH-PL62]|uniref:hypothetical protein n=1 Tax=Planctomyces sp. SH-PL62 TaxID=1636152 RepID=UPI0012E7E4A3|nr:hypothetical protein [Planctomyces sp. SH-PL62]